MAVVYKQQKLLKILEINKNNFLKNLFNLFPKISIEHFHQQIFIDSSNSKIKHGSFATPLPKLILTVYSNENFGFDNF
jgi:hypothetical protein